MKALHLILAACFFLGLPSGAGTAAQQHPAWHRWAIVASKDLQADGLPDLLTAELSRLGGLELVERERLDLAAKELEVAACFGSAAAGQRMRLGQWLKADGLLLLSIEQREQKKYVKVVISDCVYGARLRVETLVYSADGAPELAKRIASVVHAARQQFADGMRCIIAVSPFVSRDLTHDYDHWQNGFAALVEQALMTVPGVAVLELEEARSIGQELAVTGGAVRERLVPLLVDGEYATSRATPEAEPTVRLKVRVIQGDRSSEAGSPGALTEAQAVHVLAQRLPQKLIATAATGNRVPLDRNQQFALLCERAEAFAELGQWPQSLRLREAALLLQPQDVEQRLRLIREFRRWTSQRLGFDGACVPQPAEHLRTEQDRLASLRHAARNIERLVASGSIHPADAAQLLFVLRDGALGANECEMSQEILVERRRLFWNVAVRLPSLDTTLPRRFYEYDLAERWTDCVIRILLENVSARNAPVDFGGRQKLKQAATDECFLDGLYRLLTVVLPQAPPDPTVTEILTGNHDKSLVEFVRQGRATAQEVKTFLDRLMATKQPVHQFYAWCGILAMKAHRPEVHYMTPDEVQRADQLIADFTREWRLKSWSFEGASQSLQQLRDAARGKAGLAVAAGRSERFEPISPAEPGRPLSFRPVPALTASWRRMQPCGTEFDLMWAEGGVFVMRERGVVKPIFVTSLSDQVVDVCWDGENIWVALEQTGVRVLSTDGELRAHLRFGHELPPVGKGMDFKSNVGLHPVAPGRCLVLGRMGPEIRNWIALARQSPTADHQGGPAFSATIIHTATKRSDSRDDSLDQVYSAWWKTEYAEPGQTGRRLLLIGRGQRSMDQIFGCRPMAIDLETFQVSVYPARMGGGIGDDQPLCCVDGRILCYAHNDLVIYSPPPDGPRRGGWIRQHPSVPISACDSSGHTPLLVIDGKVYRPGYNWYRIDPSTGQAEQINRHYLPLRHVYRCYGVSVHYGLIAWNIGDTVHQVVFGIPADPDEELRNECFYVPDSERTKHIAAVRRLRAAGVRVDARYDTFSQVVSVAVSPSIRPDNPSGAPCATQSVVRPGIRWQTIALLPSEWRGDAATLDLLRDLWRLETLWVIGANVDNRALSHLRGLEDIRKLALVDIPVDNQGLAVLADLRSLCDLQLGATQPDCRIGDEGLRHLTALSNLTRVAISGHGFTDGSVVYLKGIRKLTQLDVPTSMLTDRAIAELQTRGITVTRNR